MACPPSASPLPAHPWDAIVARLIAEGGAFVRDDVRGWQLICRYSAKSYWDIFEGALEARVKDDDDEGRVAMFDGTESDVGDESVHFLEVDRATRVVVLHASYEMGGDGYEVSAAATDETFEIALRAARSSLAEVCMTDEEREFAAQCEAYARFEAEEEAMYHAQRSKAADEPVG